MLAMAQPIQNLPTSPTTKPMLIALNDATKPTVTATIAPTKTGTTRDAVFAAPALAQGQKHTNDRAAVPSANCARNKT